MTNERTTKSGGAWSRAAGRAAVLALLAAAGGCADHVQGVATCPCDTGVCCASGVCASEENACEQATLALSNASAGHWTGYIENYSFASGSDAIDLTLAVDGAGNLSGQLILGNGVVPAPPTDRFTRWPASDASPNSDIVMEGVPYQVTSASWNALRLRFDIELSAPWGPWCQLQEPFLFPSDPPSWICERAPNAEAACEGMSPDSLTEACRATLLGCEALCACSESGCDFRLARGVRMDVALQGNQGNGSVQTTLQPTYPAFASDLPTRNVRLIRASN